MKTQYLSEFFELITEKEFETFEKGEIREIVNVLCIQEPPFDIFGSIFSSTFALASYLKAAIE